MHSKANVKLHNRFDIEVVRDGEIIQRGQAENIVLDRIYTRLCNYSTYFVNIVYGSGTGTLDPTRTTLFTRVGSAAATTVETIKAYPVSKWTRRITLGLTTSNNQWIREVGISDDTTSVNTHALITDINGDPLEIYKTELDIIYIYATVFIELQHKDANTFFVSLPNSNSLLNYLTGSSAPGPDIIADKHESIRNTMHEIGSKTPTKTVDVNNRKVSYTARFTTTDSNDEIAALNLTNLYHANLMASGIWMPYNFTQKNVMIGIINELPLNRSRDISNLVVKIDDVVTEDYNVESFFDASSPYDTILKYCQKDTLPTTRLLGFNNNVAQYGVGNTGSKITTLKVIPELIVGKTIMIYTQKATWFKFTFTMAGSFDNVTYTTLFTRTNTGQTNNTNEDSIVISQPYEYLSFNMNVIYAEGATGDNCKFRVRTPSLKQKLTFSTPPGLIEGEELGPSDGIEDTFALANRPIVTVQGDPEADPPIETEYALTVKFDGVAINSEEYSLDANEIIFNTPPGLTYGEELGIGDGSNDTFTFKFTPDTINGIYIDSVLIDPADYTVTDDEIVFNTPPALDEIVSADYEYSCVITADYRYEVEITADYTVPYIPKTTDNVLDVSMEITFGG